MSWLFRITTYCLWGSLTTCLSSRGELTRLFASKTTFPNLSWLTVVLQPKIPFKNLYSRHLTIVNAVITRIACRQVRSIERKILSSNYTIYSWMKSTTIHKGNGWICLSGCFACYFTADFAILYQTPRRELKIRRAAEYFWRNSRCLDSRWNTVSSVWYIFSIETKTKE